MASKFFNNTDGNTLFAKLQGIAAHMAHFDQFLAVVGFFRSSGYFKLRRELGDVKHIKILIGINIDDIFRKHNKALLMLGDPDRAKEIFEESFRQDVTTCRYAPEVEEGIYQLCKDVAEGRLELRIHQHRNLHAKFYLCLPDHYTPDTDGWVIMGSSNISESGLGITQPPRYELNVALRDYDDVAYCKEEFEQLWDQSTLLTADDIEKFLRKTHLGYQPTPYELYIKVLIDTFGDQVEDDFVLQMPEGVKDLKYQRDAVIQGYQMLMQHNGLILADVVGLGKTLIATMIAKRFVEANGRETCILVVTPPAVEEAWKQTFRLFGIYNRAQFVTNGSLGKVIACEDNYREKEDFQLVIVDEAHTFRHDSSTRYDDLQKICKAPCSRPGLLHLTQKRVMLLSATPLNNRPEDLLNLLLLFQNSQRCTIDGIPNLNSFFAPFNEQYKKLMSRQAETGANNEQITRAVDELYAKIRTGVIDKVTVRRTRANILGDPAYRADLRAQGITFPKIAEPQDLEYQLDEDTSHRFYHTLEVLSDEKAEHHLHYARYRAIEFLKPELRGRYKNAEQLSKTLANIYRVHMVKRLESSFYAFRRSLHTLLRITQDMLRMFAEDKVLIIPEMDVKGLMGKGQELDEIIQTALDKGLLESDFRYKADDFSPEFLNMLRHDEAELQALCADWDQEHDDPKLDELCRQMGPAFLNPARNPSGKLVIFSESIDTVNYLKEQLTGRLGRTDILTVTSQNRSALTDTVKRNFDANAPEQEDRYNIILTTDVLAEGINLHRANVIINYDSPWNASRLMQRIGRVNRIGSTADTIWNYMFYPSKQGDKEIQLYKNALVKLQSFHSAFGEDAQIYSREEIVRQFELFDSNVKDAVDKKLSLLREVRELYATNRALYHKIKALPLKSRVLRDTGHHGGETVVFVKSAVKTEYYLVKGEAEPQAIDFLTAMRYLKAKPEEPGLAVPPGSPHFRQVSRALQAYTTAHIEAADTTTVHTGSATDGGRAVMAARKFLRTLKQTITDDTALAAHCDELTRYVDEGIYSRLPVTLYRLSREYRGNRQLIADKAYELQAKMAALCEEYHTQTATERHDSLPLDDPSVIISESFV